MKVLVIIEADKQAISTPTREVIAIAKSLCEEAEGVVIGYNIREIAQSATKSGLSRVYIIDNPTLKGVNILYHVRTIQKLITDTSPDIILAASTIYGQEMMPRLAARFGKPLLPDFKSVEVQGKEVYGTRPLFEGKFFAKMKSMIDPMAFITILPGYNPGTELDESLTGEITDFSPVILDEDKVEEFVEEKEKDIVVDITQAKLIVAGGRGVGSREKFNLISNAAKELGGMVGATRASIKAGWVSEDHKIGVTGKIVSPDLYIACGISGAIKHLIGMRRSKTIIALTTDEKSPILSVAHYAVIGDLHKVLPLLVEKLKELISN